MRESLRAHGPAWTGFFAMLAVALLLGNTIQAGLPTATNSMAGLPGPPITLPVFDKDGDTYGDSVDLVDGDLSLALRFTELQIPGTHPYLVVGTQDDQWRLGAGRALEWTHVVDPDPLGRSPGSPGWQDDVIRTGAWWYSIPQEGASKAIATTGDLTGPMEGVEWPQTFHVDVRDDSPLVTLEVSLYDAAPDPDRRHGTWDITYEVETQRWRIDDGPWGNASKMDGEHIVDAPPQTARAGDASLTFSVRETRAISPAVAQLLADTWAPTLHFASDEAFYPVPGELLHEFHGFSNTNPDLRTWTRSFNNARDAYMLFLADFNGDRTTDHHDAALMLEVLGAGGRTAPTVYSRVHETTGDRLVIQYWFIYAYNFVRDESGRDIPLLAHNGDREFIQLTFTSLAEALAGEPESVSYSQHYHGMRVPGGTPEVFVASGSHASYPAPGDDRRLRPAFLGYGDTFGGDGDQWTPGNYTVELLDTEAWHAGYQWGPITRHSRELGTAWRPLQQHTFRYPFIDPLAWQHTLREVPPEDFESMFGVA